MLLLDSQERKRRAGELLMLVGFLVVVGQFLLYNPILAGAGFLAFLVGVELYLRNRKHWNDI
jgi:membrane-bound ClpP family serine protease